MNNLLQTIKQNDEEFDKLFYETYTDKYVTATFSSKNPTPEQIKSHITQSRIKELGALVEMIEKTRRRSYNERISRGEYPANHFTPKDLERRESMVIGYNQAVDDIIQTLQNTIKELEK